jgi:hypothetical protein
LKIAGQLPQLVPFHWSLQVHVQPSGPSLPSTVTALLLQLAALVHFL